MLFLIVFQVVQIVLWIVNSGCSKHMTGDRSLLRNLIEKFMGTVRFGNDNFTAITGYGNYIQGNITIFHVCYVEGLGHNIFSVGQFFYGDLEVAFCSKICYVQNLEGDDLLTEGRESNLYTISISDMAASSPVCLMSKATSTKSLLWHRSPLSACERGNSKKAFHPPKLVPSDNSKLELLHMDLCKSMRVASTNGKKYIFVIVDDYSRYTWVYFLHSKNETPEIIKKFIAQAQLNYKAKVCKIRTDNEFLWAEAVATACFTQNRYWGVYRLFENIKRVSNLQPTNQKIMETIHVKFDKLTAIASEHDCLEPELQQFNNHNSSAEIINTPSKEDLDNFFDPMFKEYFGKKSSDTPINSTAQSTQLQEDSPSTSSINVEEHEAPPIETTSDEQTSPISLPEADELHQEDYADFDDNSQFVSYNPTSYEAIKSSLTALES
nr:integrase, catalytic region, zinc finger, CCHC-type, peptidase aspartic, catalytic [Tanacetum cinerariifolium]